MARLVFPSVGAPYRGFVGEVRGWLSRIASYQERSPESAQSLLAQLNVLVTKLGGRLIAGTTLPLRRSGGLAITPAVAVTVVPTQGGLGYLPSNVGVVQNGQKVLLPAITGTYTDGYTFNVSASGITSIVAS